MSDLERKLGDYAKALAKLTEGLRKFDGQDELARDGVIQRFEFTFELAWKCIKALLEYEGFKGLHSPRSVLREAFAGELITNEEMWLKMLKDRNLTSHLYDEGIAITISQNIQSHYVDMLDELLETLVRRLKG